MPPDSAGSNAPKRGRKGFFGFGRTAEAEEDARDARLLTLRESLPVALDDAIEAPDVQEDAELAVSAELQFLAGPREGVRVELNGNVVPLGQGKSSANIWRHGERFLLRHNGKQVRVSGASPQLSIVALEDGDEIIVGADHARFRILPHQLP